MGGYEAFLQLFGDIRITDILVFVLAAGYIVPKTKEAYIWLRRYLKKSESKEKAIGNAEKLGDYHQQSIEIRNRLQEQIQEIQADLNTIKGYHEENAAVRMGLQAVLRSMIVSEYYRYENKRYMPISARESLRKVYEAYTGLGGNDVAHDLYEKMRRWDIDPEEESTDEH